MHLALSLLFGMIIALAVPFLRRVWMQALGAAVYGILLWVINFGAIRSARDIESRGSRAL